MRRRIAMLLLLLLTVSGCAATSPEPSPGEVIHVRNDSDRAVMAAMGGPIGGDSALAVRPCGGELSVPVASASYEEDGRLLAFLAIDPSGAFDVALKAHEGDPADLPGTFASSIIWSDGTLAGRLPLYLTVASDRTVAVSSAPDEPPGEACEPAY